MAKEKPRLVSRVDKKIRGYRFDNLFLGRLSIPGRNARCAPVGIIIYHFFTKVNSRLSRALFIGEPRKQLAVLGNFDHINWPFRETEYTEHTETMWLFVQFGLQNRTIGAKKDAKNAHGAVGVVEAASSSLVTQTK